VLGHLYALDITYEKIGRVPMEKPVRDSEQPIGSQTNALVFKLEFLQQNNASLP